MVEPKASGRGTGRARKSPAKARRAPANKGTGARRDQEVLEAATKVFHARGYADASVQDIADELGILKGSLYHYIDSKEQLLYGILAESHAEAVEITERVEALEVEPVAKLRTYLQLMAEWYLAHVERVAIYFRESDQLTGDRLQQVQSEQRSTARYLRRLIAAAQDAGEVRADRDPRLSALLIFGTMNSFPDWYRPGGPTSATQVVSTFIDWTLAALGVADDRRAALTTDAAPV